MGTGEESTSSKPSSKPASSSQEVPPTTPYTDWSTSMQAYYGAAGTPPPFFPSTVASPSPHPYIWGGQHPLMPPYGTPVPYPAMYPPGGVYAHPNMATAPSAAPTNTELVGKSPNVKDQGSARNLKGGKGASGSGNDGASQSGESGSEGSSDGSDEQQANQQELSSNKKGSFGQMLADASAQNMPGKHLVPATNLNVGMSLWNQSDASAGAAIIRPNSSGAAAPVPLAMGGREGGMPERWMDERELKRQKRKQSNRESARRSRLRKQAECDELQARVESLNNENRSLREELQKLSEECEKLTSENSSIKDELAKVCGPEAVASIEQAADSAIHSQSGEGNS